MTWEIQYRNLNLSSEKMLKLNNIYSNNTNNNHNRLRTKYKTNLQNNSFQILIVSLINN